MSGPKRNPDKLNTIGVVVVGVCGAVLVYVTIVALQAFYMNDTSEIQTMADYGGNDATARSIRSTQTTNIGEFGSNPAAAGKPATFRVPIDVAMQAVIADAKQDPANLVPTVGRSETATVQPVFGRPKPIAGAAPAATDGAGSAAGSGSGSAAPAGAGSGSAAVVPSPAAPMTPTGGMGPGGGSAATAPKGNAPPQ